MHQIVCRLGFAPDPTAGAYVVPSDPIAVFRGPTSKGREEGEGNMRGGEGEKRKGRGEEGRGCERRRDRERGEEGGSSSFAPGRKRKVGAYIQ